MTDRIRDFLKETELQNRASGYWGIGTVVARAGAGSVLSLFSVKSASDQFVIASNSDLLLPKVSQILAKLSISVKDPALFDVPTASFSALLCKSFAGIMGKPCLIFVTVRAVSDASSHVLIEGHTLGAARLGQAHVKEVADEIRKVAGV